MDYTSPLKDVIMETESGVGGLTYRFTYGLEKNSAVIYGIPNGVGSVAQSYTYPNGTANVVKLYYHHDRLGSTDYLTDNVAGDPTSYTEYDDWGAMTMKPILQLGTRELDLVSEYTGHPYDQVLGLYFAEARMYDAADRRFTAVDPVKGSIKSTATLVQYTYVVDNPMRFVDPWGEDAILINKQTEMFPAVDHMSMLVEDPDGNWWFYYWGERIMYLKIGDKTKLKSFNTLNRVLNELYPKDIEGLSDAVKKVYEPPALPIEQNPYYSSVYIVGNFSATHFAALKQLEEFEQKLIAGYAGKKYMGKFIINEYYGVLTNNCSQNAMELLMLGTLPSGINVGKYIEDMNGISISAIPDKNLKNMQKIFFNTALTIEDFNRDISALKEEMKYYEWLSAAEINLPYILPKN